MSATLPVTEAEATQTNIGYSVKIGKQVIKQQLKQEITSLNAEIYVEDAKQKVAFNGSSFVQLLEDGAKSAVNLDDDLSEFRRLINTMLPARQAFETNWAMTDGCDSMGVLELIRGGMYTHNSMEYLSECVRERKVSINVSINIHSGNTEDYSPTQCEMNYDIELNQQWIDILQVMVDTRRNKLNLKLKVITLESKIDDLDNVMEEMEAQLLVNQLNKSVEGQAVLDVTSNMVKQLLGEVPNLLLSK